MRFAVILLVLLLGLGAVHAIGGKLVAPSTEVLGAQFIPTPNITHDTSKSYTVIEAQIENTGFEKVFVSLPKGWSYDSQILSAKGEPIIVSKPALHRKYGSPGDRYSFISNYFVFWQRGGFAISKGSPLTVYWADGGTSYGWYVRPNERLVFTIKMTPSETEAIIDPFTIEQNRSDIKVVEWNQEFYIYPEPYLGFLRAPWILKNVTMVEAYPGIFANLSAFTGDRYYDLFKLETPPPTTAPPPEELNPPAWDEWFTSSGLFSLTPSSLASLKTEFLPIPEVNKTKAEEEEPSEEVFIPVWYVDRDVNFIRYRYEWQRGKTIKGIDVHLYTEPPLTLTERFGNVSATTPSTPTETAPKLDLTTVPEWYAWF